MAKSNLMKSTAILTIAQFISKLLGFIYVIPFIALIGTKGYILFEYGYKPYTIMLSVATLGVPSAISKLVSRYNSVNEYNTTRKIFKMGMLFSFVTGIASFALLYLLAPSISTMLIDPNDPTGNTIEEITYVIRLVSTALLVVPFMSVIRGYFQGHNAMFPTAVSQLVEQLVRVVFILTITYIILAANDGELHIAVGLATFGATVGAVASLASLLWFLLTWRNRIHAFPKKEEVNNRTETTSLLAKELLFSAIPLVLIGLAIPLFQLIETFTINKPLMSIGYSQIEAETVNSLIALVQKLILIPVGLATALSLTLLPAVTAAFTRKNSLEVKGLITETMQILSWVLIPSVGMVILLSDSLFGLMFGLENANAGGRLMAWYAPSIILYSLYMVTANILQGIAKEKFTIICLIIAVALKYALNPILVSNFEGIGTIISTNIGFIVAVGLHFWGLKRFAEYSFNETNNLFTKVIKSSFVSLGGSFLLLLLLERLFGSYDNTLAYNLALLLLVGGFGISLYILMSFKTNLLYDLMGENYRFLKRMKKKKDSKRK